MPADPSSDPFSPPEVPTEVCCIHCGETYDSWQIEWRTATNQDGVEQGFWCCPMPGCDGMGFGFDILPTDPNYQDERGGWVHDDDSEDEDDDIELFDFDEDWLEADDVPPELRLTDDIPFDEPDERPPQNGKSKLGDDWPFSMN